VAATWFARAPSLAGWLIRPSLGCPWHRPSQPGTILHVTTSQRRYWLVALSAIAASPGCGWGESYQARRELQAAEKDASTALGAMRTADSAVEKARLKLEPKAGPSTSDGQRAKLPPALAEAIIAAGAAGDYQRALEATVKPGAEFVLATQRLRHPRVELERRHHLAACAGGKGLEVACIAAWEEMVSAADAFGRAAAEYGLGFGGVRRRSARGEDR